MFTPGIVYKDFVNRRSGVVYIFTTWLTNGAKFYDNSKILIVTLIRLGAMLTSTW